MNINAFINEMSWGKLSMIILIFISVSWVIHEILFFTFYHEMRQTANQINTQITQTQKNIQKKLTNSDKEFNERNKRFGGLSDDFQKTVEQKQRQVSDYIDNMVKEDEKKQTIFDKEFKEAPARMWKKFEEAGNAMRADYDKNSQRIQDKFQHNQRKLLQQKGE